MLDAARAADLDVAFAPGFLLDGEPSPELTGAACAAAADADVTIVFLGLPAARESEGYDRDTISLPSNQLALLEALRTVSRQLVVVLANGSVVSLEEVRQHADAIVESWLGGQAMAEGVLDVLLGKVNPSGKLSETIPLRLEDSPSYLSFPGELGRSHYSEGIFVGYRGHDRRGSDVAYPFGFGLSYSTFSMSIDDVEIEGKGSAATCSVVVNVQNTGDVAGAEVVQLYVGDEEATVAKPPRELRDFAKVHLAPGEASTVTFNLTGRDFAHWHEPLSRWVVEGGRFSLDIGSSSRHIADTAWVSLEGDDLRQPLTVMSTLGELMRDPVVGDEFRAIIEAQPEQFQRQAPDIPAITFVDFNIFELDREGLNDLLQRANQHRGA